MISSLKQRIILLIVAVGIALIAIFYQGFYSKPSEEAVKTPERQSTQPEIQSDNPEIISINPEGLQGSTVIPTQVIEFTFNTQLNNDPVDVKIEPELKITAEVINNGRTLKITPVEPYKVGSGYTLTIRGEYDLANGKKLGKDFIYNFKTIEYRGI